MPSSGRVCAPTKCRQFATWLALFSQEGFGANIARALLLHHNLNGTVHRCIQAARNMFRKPLACVLNCHVGPCGCFYGCAFAHEGVVRKFSVGVPHRRIRRRLDFVFPHCLLTASCPCKAIPWYGAEAVTDYAGSARRREVAGRCASNAARVSNSFMPRGPEHFAGLALCRRYRMVLLLAGARLVCG